MSRTSAKFLWIVYTLILLDSIHGESLTLSSTIQDMCSRSLSTLIFQICTGNVPISDLPVENLSKVRGKRAALFSRDIQRRMRRQVADECCLHPCSVADLIQYCPETWWRVRVADTFDKWKWFWLIFEPKLLQKIQCEHLCLCGVVESGGWKWCFCSLIYDVIVLDLYKF